MHTARFRVMAGLAAATLCLFAVSSNAQTPATTGTPDVNAQTTTPAQPATPTNQATTPPADQTVTPTGTATDATPTTTATPGFPGGTLGLLAVGVLVLLVLFALFRGRDRTVVRETYTTTPPVTRTPGIGTAADDRLNVPRAASGPGTNTGGINDPNARS